MEHPRNDGGQARCYPAVFGPAFYERIYDRRLVPGPEYFRPLAGARAASQVGQAQRPVGL